MTIEREAMKTRQLVFVALIVIVLFPAMAFAAVGTVTQTWAAVTSHVSTLTLSWVASSTDGSVPATTTASNIDGYVIMVVTNPGAGPPQASYDITLTDSDGVDIVGGVLASRSQTATEQVRPLIGGVAYGDRFVSGKLTFTLTGNNVNSAAGTVVIYIVN